MLTLAVCFEGSLLSVLAKNAVVVRLIDINKQKRCENTEQLMLKALFTLYYHLLTESCFVCEKRTNSLNI